MLKIYSAAFGPYRGALVELDASAIRTTSVVSDPCKITVITDTNDVSALKNMRAHFTGYDNIEVITEDEHFERLIRTCKDKDQHDKVKPLKLLRECMPNTDWNKITSEIKSEIKDQNKQGEISVSPYAIHKDTVQTITLCFDADNKDTVVAWRDLGKVIIAPRNMLKAHIEKSAEYIEDKIMNGKFVVKGFAPAVGRNARIRYDSANKYIELQSFPLDMFNAMICGSSAQSLLYSIIKEAVKKIVRYVDMNTPRIINTLGIASGLIVNSIREQQINNHLISCDKKYQEEYRKQLTDCTVHGVTELDESLDASEWAQLAEACGLNQRLSSAADYHDAIIASGRLDSKILTPDSRVFNKLSEINRMSLDVLRLMLRTVSAISDNPIYKMETVKRLFLHEMYEAHMQIDIRKYFIGSTAFHSRTPRVSKNYYWKGRRIDAVMKDSVAAILHPLTQTATCAIDCARTPERKMDHLHEYRKEMLDRYNYLGDVLAQDRISVPLDDIKENVAKELCGILSGQDSMQDKVAHLAAIGFKFYYLPNAYGESYSSPWRILCVASGIEIYALAAVCHLGSDASIKLYNELRQSIMNEPQKALANYCALDAENINYEDLTASAVPPSKLNDVEIKDRTEAILTR